MLSLALNVIRIVIFGGILFMFYVLNVLDRTPHSSGPRECTAYCSAFKFIVQVRNQVVRNATLHSALCWDLHFNEIQTFHMHFKFLFC